MRVEKIIITIAIFVVMLLQPLFARTILVSNVLSNSVTLFDEATLLKVNDIKVGYRPHEVVISPDGRLALVSNFGDLLSTWPGNSLTSIDIANASVAQTIQLPNKSRPHGIAFISNAQALVTVQGIQSLLKIEVEKGKIEETLHLPGAGAHMVIVDYEKHFAYVANVDSGSVVKIDLRNFSVLAEMKIGGEAEGMALSAEEDLLLVTDRKDNYVAVLKTKDLSIQKKISTDCGPVRVVLFNHGQSAVVMNTLGSNAQVIDMNTLEMTSRFRTTISSLPLSVPINVEVRDDQVTAYITNSFVNDIALVDLIHGKVLKTFKAGYMPDGVATSDIDAINTKNASDAEFKAEAITINANIEKVWTVVKNVEDYNKISHGAVSAHMMDGELAPGKTIKLALYPNTIKGKFIPESYEIVTVVDENRKILSWMRQLPDGSFTERYQILEKISENVTASSILVRIPGVLGEMAKITWGATINEALVSLNNGIKEQAEIN